MLTLINIICIFNIPTVSINRRSVFLLRRIEMYISKDGDIRKQELLDAAFELFCENGYDKTSVNSIIEKVGVSKGAFYYYFKSKKEVMDTLIIQEVEKLIPPIQALADNDTMTAVEKMNELVNIAQSFRINNAEKHKSIHEMLYLHEDRESEKRMLREMEEKVSPHYTKIIEQGIKEGTIHTDYPDLFTDFIFAMRGSLSEYLTQFYMNPETIKDNIDLIQRKAEFFTDCVERVLGMEKGTIQFVDLLVKQVDAIYKIYINKTKNNK